MTLRGPAAIRVGAGGLVVVISPDAVKVACAARGWSISELARRSGISMPTMASALRGKPVRPRTAWKIARGLEKGERVLLSELFDEDQPAFERAPEDPQGTTVP